MLQKGVGNFRASGDTVAQEWTELGRTPQLRNRFVDAAVQQQQLAEPLMSSCIIRVEDEGALIVSLGFAPAPSQGEQIRARRVGLGHGAVEGDGFVNASQTDGQHRVDAHVRIERQDGIDIGDPRIRLRERRISGRSLLEERERAAKSVLAPLLEEEASPKIEVIRLQVVRAACRR